MFQFPAFASINYVFIYGLYRITGIGFPHSEIPESKTVCVSSGLFAAYHVLLRFLEPRHPPYALNYLIFYLLEIGLQNLNIRLLPLIFTDMTHSL